MARYAIEFLRTKFSKSFEEVKNESPTSFVVPLSDFSELEHVVKRINTTEPDLHVISCEIEKKDEQLKQVIKEPGEKLSNPTITLLYELNDALADCRVSAKTTSKAARSFLFGDWRKYSSVQSMTKQLRDLTSKFQKLVPDQVKEVDNDIANVQEERIPEGHHDQLHVHVTRTPIDVMFGRSRAVFGFEKQAERIEGLLNPTEDVKRALATAGLGCFGVVGIAGVGKTTLVRKVLYNMNTRQVFSPIIWIRILDVQPQQDEQADTNLNVVTRILAELDVHDSVDDKENDINDDNAEQTMSYLLQKMKNHLVGKRYLIVLDDVWNMNDFFSDIGAENKGSKDRLSDGLPKNEGGVVIVTTRRPQVAEQMVGANNLIPVRPIEKQNCWSMLKEAVPESYDILHAFDNGPSEKLESRRVLQNDMKEVKDQIEEEFQGLPLAVKVLEQIIPKSELVMELQKGSTRPISVDVV